jgi:hypothetical protein
MEETEYVFKIMEETKYDFKTYKVWIRSSKTWLMQLDDLIQFIWLWPISTSGIPKERPDSILTIPRFVFVNLVTVFVLFHSTPPII